MCVGVWLGGGGKGRKNGGQEPGRGTGRTCGRGRRKGREWCGRVVRIRNARRHKCENAAGKGRWGKAAVRAACVVIAVARGIASKVNNGRYIKVGP